MDLSNLLNLDYKTEAQRFIKHSQPIIDFHAHIHGGKAAEIYKEVMDLYGIGTVYSMTPLEEVAAVKKVLGERLQLIAFPIFRGKNPQHEHGEGYLDRISDYHKLGAKIVKFWAAPRGIDLAEQFGASGILALDTPARRKAMQLAVDLKMAIMVHVADPNTWFMSHYRDISKYGDKASQYQPLEELINLYPTKWIAAHMGGWPEDLNFLGQLLNRHSNLYLDSSATKWIVREISKHSRESVLEFMTNWQGRILFGSDIVTSDDHLSPSAGTSIKGDQANSKEEAFDLYGSRYWALRTLWETDYNGFSPIADPDLALAYPEKYKPTDSPLLIGKKLPQGVLEHLYFKAAEDLL